jgi:hypothetical protein
MPAGHSIGYSHKAWDWEVGAYNNATNPLDRRLSVQVERDFVWRRLWFGIAILTDAADDRVVETRGRIVFKAAGRKLREYPLSLGISQVGIPLVPTTLQDTFPLPCWNVESLGIQRNPQFFGASAPLGENFRRAYWEDSLTGETYRVTMAPITFVQEMEEVEIQFDTLTDSLSGDGKVIAWLFVQSQNGVQ